MEISVILIVVIMRFLRVVINEFVFHIASTPINLEDFGVWRGFR